MNTYQKIMHLVYFNTLLQYTLPTKKKLSCYPFLDYRTTSKGYLERSFATAQDDTNAIFLL